MFRIGHFMQVVLAAPHKHNVRPVRMALETDFSLHELHARIDMQRNAGSRIS